MRRFVIAVVVVWSSVAHADPVNAVIGDASWAVGDPELAGEDTRIAAHLTYVLARLRAVPGSQERARMLDVLADYIARGEFPRRTGDGHPGRRPRFIDDRGVHCAVGYLIARSGHGELARAIDERFEYAYVPEIESPALVAWAEEYGFTLEELAMIQPAYGGAPTAGSTRRGIERAKLPILLACAAKHPPLREVKLTVVGDADYRATARTASKDPFAQCFAAHASRVERGGGAYDESSNKYRFDMIVQLPTLQELLTERMTRYTIYDPCTPRPGALPRTAAYEIATSAEGLGVRVTTKPHNAEVAACLEKHARIGFRDFAAIRSPLFATAQRALVSRFAGTNFQTQARSYFKAQARACAAGQPATLSGTVSAKVDDKQFTIALDTPDEALAACVTEKLQRSLRESFSVYRELPDGKSERYFRIDRDVAVTVGVDLARPPPSKPRMPSPKYR